MERPSSKKAVRLGRLRAAILLWAAAFSPGALASPPTPAASARDELQRTLDQIRQDIGAPGAILGVQGAAGPPLVVASGLADREQKRPMQADDPIQLGSVTKTYTATVILRLAEQGKLSLDDKVARFLPDFPRGQEITLRHLIEQTSGLKDFYMHIYFRPDREEMLRMVTKDWKESELLELAGRFGHWTEPGAEWAYSNVNYYLLAVIAERAGGLPLTETYRRQIYQPLGLERTWLPWHEDAKATLTTGYMGKIDYWPHSEMFGELGATTQLDRSPVEYGAGGLVAPAADALAFLRGLLHGKLLAPATLEAMTQFRPIEPLGVEKVDPTERDGYGQGLIRTQRAGRTLLGHGGLFTGHTAGLWHLPECDLTLVLYFNRGFVGQRAILDRLIPLLLRDPMYGSSCGRP